MVVDTANASLSCRRALELLAASHDGCAEAIMRAPKAELDTILERRPELKGKSLEAAKRIIRRDARLSLKPRRTSPST